MKASIKSMVFASVLLAGCNSETIIETPINTSSPYSNKVYEYKPAPGQFINNPQSGFENVTTEQAAAEYAQNRLKNTEYVSLGGFGGYIIVGFDHHIENRGSFNGYDFSIRGNQFDNSSEPAIVFVMQDANNNGLPDDVWYELKGSEYENPATIKNYSVTYYKPENPRENVRWTDNRDSSGYIEINQFNKQDYYYPLWISDDSYTLSGICLESKGYIDQITGNYCTGNYDWGYADNLGSDMIDGQAGKNFFKINNAVKTDGTSANLQYINFIKIQNATNAHDKNNIGESSAEILCIKDENLNNG
jgi:hypothetical protein